MVEGAGGACFLPKKRWRSGFSAIARTAMPPFQRGRRAALQSWTYQDIKNTERFPSEPGGPTFDSLSTYTSDGGLVFNDQGSVITEPPFPHVFSAGHGVWVHQGGRTFSLTSRQLISDLEGALLFRLKLQQTLTLNRSRDAYRSVWKAEFTDPAGNLSASFEGTTEGQRIKAEPLP